MRMHHAVLALTMLFTVGAVCANEPAARVELENEIRRLDLAHAAAIFRGDEAALTELMSPDLTVNHPTNKIVNETQGILDMIRSGVILYSAFERVPEKIMLHDDMAVVMGHEFVTPAEGAPNAGKALQRRYTNIWMQRDGRWQLTIRHANNVCP